MVTLAVLAGLSLYPAGLFPQDAILVSYKRNFLRTDLAGKAGVLMDAAIDDRSSEFIGSLYAFALEFVLDGGEFLRDDPDMIALAGIAARGAGEAGHKPSAETLWQIFALYQDSYSRVEIFRALAALGKGNAGMVEKLNRYLADQVGYYRSGMIPDYPTLRACVAALASIGDDSTYPVLFSAILAAYPGSLDGEITEAMQTIEGDYLRFLMEIIRKNSPAEKLTAFRLGAGNPQFSPAERGELAEAALEVSLDFVPGESGTGSPSDPGWAAASSLRYESVIVLTELKWIKANPLAIRNFYQVQTDFGSAAAPRERLLEAVACLGVMENSEAAQVLALQLGYINSQTERGGEFDEDLILALIRALGEIGDKVAFDYLLYIGYINYPERIQAAARESLNRLKW
ncbi:MAG: hypothetical protein LBQ67_03010 [Treponema sp.]|jgi:hypothetical protein|nr:hypothetical protein [Treponema sp.]